MYALQRSYIGTVAAIVSDFGELPESPTTSSAKVGALGGRPGGPAQRCARSRRYVHGRPGAPGPAVRALAVGIPAALYRLATQASGRIRASPIPWRRG